MAKKEDTNGSSFGDITVLRNILMGKQIDEYDVRFTNLESRVQEQEVIFKQKLQALEQRMTEQIGQMQKNMSIQVNGLEELLQKEMQVMNAKTSQQQEEDRRKIGEMLIEMGKRLLE